MSPGISCSARRSSLRPNSASPRSATLYGSLSGAVLRVERVGVGCDSHQVSLRWLCLLRRRAAGRPSPRTLRGRGRPARRRPRASARRPGRPAANSASIAGRPKPSQTWPIVRRYSSYGWGRTSAITSRPPGAARARPRRARPTDRSHGAGGGRRARGRATPARAGDPRCGPRRAATLAKPARRERATSSISGEESTPTTERA